MRVLPILVLLPPAGCALVKPPGPTAVLPHADDPWRIIATDVDRERLRDWRDSFVNALDAARKGGRGADLAREGVLLNPDSAQPNAAPPVGAYRCRWVKLGAQDPARPPFLTFQPVPCRVDPAAKGLTFQMTIGPQRAVGRFLPEINRRMVFLGTLQIGDERGTLRYG